jgi:hypothetical protein
MAVTASGKGPLSYVVVTSGWAFLFGQKHVGIGLKGMKKTLK